MKTNLLHVVELLDHFACALVRRPWAQWAQRYLFRTFSGSGALDPLVSSPHLVDHTQRLILQVSTLKPHPIIDLGTLKLTPAPSSPHYSIAPLRPILRRIGRHIQHYGQRPSPSIRHLILSGFLMGGRSLSALTCTTDPVTLDTLSLLWAELPLSESLAHPHSPFDISQLLVLSLGTPGRSRPLFATRPLPSAFHNISVLDLAAVHSSLSLDLSPLPNLRLLRIETPDPPTALRILSTLPFSSSHPHSSLEDVTLELEIPAITGDVRVDNYWEHFPLLRERDC
ncbi:hypothetical protein B0H14DRAFT_3433672 [Mycena olivaceomarginata]|nr:hypothetical protein B0H14DRAFT_3433672 [Mycena olivaceomarginata]